MGWEDEQEKQAQNDDDRARKAKEAADELGRLRDAELNAAMDSIRRVIQSTAERFGATLELVSKPDGSEIGLRGGDKTFMVSLVDEAIQFHVDGEKDQPEMIFNASYSKKVALQPQPKGLRWRPAQPLTKEQRLALKGEVDVSDYAGNFVTWWVKQHGFKRS